MPDSRASHGRKWLGVILLAVGLLGHLLAAHAIGSSTIAYSHHVAGFLGLSVVSGILIAGLGWRFWRGRHDITLLILGALQTLLGLIVYIERFHSASRTSILQQPYGFLLERVAKDSRSRFGDAPLPSDLLIEHLRAQSRAGEVSIKSGQAQVAALPIPHP
ncbi:MAG: hypothetical protein ACR2OG_17350 [Gemmatimonadaceae bacterium]